MRTQTAFSFALLLCAAPAVAQQTVALPRADRALAATPTPLFTIGKEDGETWETFSGVIAVDFDAQDNLYVLDSRNQRIVVFDRDGRFVRVLGGRGGGPGEFQFPMALALSPRGIIVVDAGHRAYITLSPEGEEVSRTPLPQGQLMPVVMMRAHPREGVVIAAPQSMDMQKLAEQAQAGGTIRMDMGSRIFIETNPLTASATPTRLFEHVAIEPDADEMEMNVGPMRMVMPVPPTFAPGLHWDVLPDGGIAVANRAEYSVAIVSPSGSTVRTITRPLAPRAVTAADQEHARTSQSKAMEEGMRGNPLPAGAGAMMQDVMKQRIENMRFAPVMPVLSGLRVDARGHLWLLRTSPNVEAKHGPIDIVAADGRYVGTVAIESLPAAFSRSGRAAWIETDDLGVERVVVEQLPASWLVTSPVRIE